MAKEKTVFVCSACGYETPRWMGKCPGCNAWNTLEEQAPQAAQQAAPVKANKQRPGTGASAIRLSEIPEETSARATTGIGELDRVLGGGVVEGSLMLVGGDPGIGKSTLLLQASEHLAQNGARVLYISGEESVRQIKMRARRLGVTSDNLLILSENAMDAAERRWEEIAPDYMIIDSIQTMYRPDMASAPGSVSQVRECASLLMRMAKTTGCAVFLVGHVTKEGAIAGPRVLEHMVDVVLYFEGDRQHEYRILRAVKNRFGSVNELGLFEMRERCRWKIRRNCCFPRGRATCPARAYTARSKAHGPCWWMCRRWPCRRPMARRGARRTALTREGWRCCWPCWKSARACRCSIRMCMSTLRAGLSCPNRRRICRSARRSLPACATHACRAIGR